MSSYQIWKSAITTKLKCHNIFRYIFFWYIEHYGASVRDDFDAKMNYFKHIEVYIDH